MIKTSKFGVGIGRLAVAAMTVLALAPLLFYGRRLYLHYTGAEIALRPDIYVIGACVALSAGAVLLAPSMKARVFGRRASVLGRFVFMILRFLFTGVVCLHFYAVADRVELLADAPELVPLYVTVGVGAFFLFAMFFPRGYALALAQASIPVKKTTSHLAPTETQMYRVEEAERMRQNPQRAMPASLAKKPSFEERLTERSKVLDKDRRRRDRGKGVDGVPLVSALFQIFLIVLFIGGLYGVFVAQAVPTAELWNWYEANSVYLIYGAVGFVVLCSPFLPSRSSNVFLRNGILRQAVLGVAIWFAAGFLMEGLVLKGAPALAALAQNPPPTSQARVVVTGKGETVEDGGLRRRCSYSVMAKGGELIGDKPITICDLGERVWSSVGPGDTITLVGQRTDIGFRYTFVKR